MVLIQGWIPPTRENYQILMWTWTFVIPVLVSFQWLTSWYGMGKTSKASMFNLPGKGAWMFMECFGWLLMVYLTSTMPALHGITDLPWQNKVLAALYVIHYMYRDILYPLLQPSMAPMHVLVFLFAIIFQVFNGIALGSWLGAFGPTTQEEWQQQWGAGGLLQFVLGIALFYVGLALNFYHDEELREIRRREVARQERLAKQQSGVSTEKKQFERHYEIPKAGLFKYMLYPHYFVEWVEWFGFWMACGWSSAPARCFLLGEVFSMLPRAVRGKQWYIEKFGEEKIRGKWAVIPGVW